MVNRLFTEANIVLSDLVPLAAAASLYPVNPLLSKIALTAATYYVVRPGYGNFPFFSGRELDSLNVNDILQNPLRPLCGVILFTGVTGLEAVVLSVFIKSLNPLAASLAGSTALCHFALTMHVSKSVKTYQNIEKQIDILIEKSKNVTTLVSRTPENEERLEADARSLSIKEDLSFSVKSEKCYLFKWKKNAQRAERIAKLYVQRNFLNVLSIGILAYPIILKLFPAVFLSNPLMGKKLS